MDYAAGEVIVTFKPEYLPAPNEVTAAPPAFGITALDSLIDAVDGQTLVKLVPTYGALTTELGQLMERKFLLVYGSEEDPMELRGTLLEQPCFEDVTVNTLWWFELSGTNRIAPGDTTRFPDQWYFDNTDTGDMSDIDMPEAWAIEQGDPDLVIGIFDSGIMVDRCVEGGNNWRLHSDFNYFFLPDEDHGTPGVLNFDDLNGEDNGILPDGFVDNVIGTNLTTGCLSCGDQNPMLFWKSIPSDWLIGEPFQCPDPDVECCPPPPDSWDVYASHDHGTRVASIAAGKMDGLKRKNVTGPKDHKDIVGAAPNCKIYSVRFGCPLGDAEAALALRLLATHCKVVNMSFGTPSENFFDGGSSAFKEMTVTVTQDAMFDCVLISSTGNAARAQSAGNGVNYPAYFDSVLAVGGMSRWESLESGTPQRAQLSKYSSTELKVDLLAPIEPLPTSSQGILANKHASCGTGPPCGSGFGPSCNPDEIVLNSTFGTSFAAPQVSGVAALVRSRFPSLNQFQVKQRLKRSAEFYWSGSPPSYQHGYGKVNAYRALTEWGSITENTTWSATDTRDGKYYISGDLTIEAGATLTIAEGCSLFVAPDHEGAGSDPNRVQIVVNGSLVINGTAENPVVFESFTDSAPTESDWIGIKFAAGSSGVLRHVRIKNAVEDVVVDEFAVTVADWDPTKELYLNSDLSITADRTIPASDSLFVLGASDVIVTAGAGVDITVYGSLICKGSATKKPEFRSSTGASWSWGLITLASGSENHRFLNTIIRDAQLAIRTFVPVSIEGCLITEGIDGVQAYADLTVTSSTFQDLTASAIRLYAGSLSVTGTTIDDCGYGIDQSTQTSTGAITCTGSVIRNCEYRGINVQFPSSGVTIRRTAVQDVTDGVFLAYQNAATIDSCTIERAGNGILSFACGNLFVGHSRIDSCATTGVYLEYHTTNVTLAADTVRYSPVGGFWNTLSSGTLSSASRVVGNTTGVKGDGGSTIVMRNTLVTGSTVGVVGLNDAMINMGYATSGTGCNASGPDIGNNSIHTNSSHDAVNLSPSIEFPAEGNYWDPQGPDPSKFSGAVDYEPYICNDPLPPSFTITLPPPEEEPGSGLPTRYELFASGPNPFNPTTTMRYDVPPPGGIVRIAIYDVRGALVRVLVNGHQPAGAHTALWGGLDDRGAPAASGMYFVRMSAPAFVQTRKVVLIK